jgi:PST family polysaccharide transporter
MAVGAAQIDDSPRPSLTIIHGSLITPGLGLETPPTIAAPLETTTVARKMAGGAVWTLLAFAVGKGLGFVTNIVLARLLAPDDFGLVSFAMVLIGAFLLLQDLGVGAAIVYSRASIREIGGTALMVNLLTATLLFGIVGVIAGVVAYATDADQLAAIVTALAFGLVATAAGSVQTALLTKELAFRRKFLPDVLPLVVSGVVSVICAVLGYGVWSLVWGYLAKSFCATAILWAIAPERPQLTLNRAVARDLLRYGKHISLSSVIGFAVMNVDYLIVGQRLGATALGLYTLAFTVASLPSTIIGQQIAATTFPAYTRLRSSPAALGKLFGDTFTVTSALAIAFGAAIWVGMPSLIGPLLGTKWLAMVDPLRILTIFGVLRAIEFSFSPFYRAVGRPEIMWIASTVRLIVVAPALFWAAGYGIERVAWVQVAIGLLILPIHGAIVARLLNNRPWQMLSLFAPQLLSVAGLLAAIAGCTMSEPLRMAAQQPLGASVLAAVGILMQMSLLVWARPTLIESIRSLVARA